MPSRTSLLICVPLVLALVGCSAGGATQPPPDPPTAEEGQQVVDTLPECEGFLFDEGETLSGKVVAACVAATMVAHSFGKMTVESADTTGLTTFRYRPDFAASVTLSGGEQLLINGDEMWFKDDLGWVEAVEGSADPRENLAYMVTSVFRGLSDPRSAITMLEAATVWTIFGEDEIETVEGDSRTAWRLDADPFMLMGVQLDELSLWVDSSYTTLQQRGTASFGGETATTLNRYYDWGVEEEFVVPPVS